MCRSNPPRARTPTPISHFPSHTPPPPAACFILFLSLYILIIRKRKTTRGRGGGVCGGKGESGVGVRARGGFDRRMVGYYTLRLYVGVSVLAPLGSVGLRWAPLGFRGLFIHMCTRMGLSMRGRRGMSVNACTIAPRRWRTIDACTRRARPSTRPPRKSRTPRGQALVDLHRTLTSTWSSRTRRRPRNRPCPIRAGCRRIRMSRSDIGSFPRACASYSPVRSGPLPEVRGRRGWEALTESRRKRARCSEGERRARRSTLVSTRDS